ncbi:unnamed protein product [Rotaria sordida]|uniref:Amino acid transporter n=2 Tax=Rotaria sordida TaxID=392033 RepID=A0A815D8J5_9BILA|nr:unnamed protein product [Rotaria sordida]CAF1294413.1 unnamed protein product [Rotaria sordida]
MSSPGPSPAVVVMTAESNVVKEDEEEPDIRREHEMGYHQELYRGFSPFMSFAFCFTAVNVLTSLSISFTDALRTGGSGVAIWSWFVGSGFTILVGLSLAEICSVYPSAGSVYYWAGQLVSTRHAPLASFICGWFNFIGNASANAAFSSGFASIVNAALILDGKQSLSTGAQVGISIGITVVWAIQNIFRIDQQGWFNNLAAIFQITSTISTVVVLLVMAPERASAHDVFISTYNGTGFPFLYMCCIGILSTLFSMAGYDAGAHLAEETQNASLAAPRGIIGTCVIGAVVGAAYLLALLFAIPDMALFMENNNDDNSSLNLAVAAYKLAVPRGGALALTILLVVNVYFGGMSSITVTSRIGFAMARDGVFPFSSSLRWIFPPTKAPLVIIALVVSIDCLLLLLQLASTTAFAAIISIATLGFQISYVIPIFFRCTVGRKRFPVGEFNLGRFSLPIAIVSVVWLFITSIFMFFPSTYPVTGDNMNYAIVIIGGVALIAGTYWIVSARHWFMGPKRDRVDSIVLPPVFIATVHFKNTEE